MSPAITVIVPAHNPRLDYLQAALAALDAQSLPKTEWNLLVVDNASKEPLAGRLDLRWHPAAEVLREEKLGLTHARLEGFRRATGHLIVLVDDDNVLAPDYLSQAEGLSRRFPHLGAFGGGIAPQFERPDLAPPKSLSALLTLREVCEDLWSNDPEHHGSTPWGAGLCLRREVAEAYLQGLIHDARGLELDLQGDRLLYGGDSDIAFASCRIGLGKGVFRALRLEHLIPALRCSTDYLLRVSEGRGYSEVLHHLVRTGELPTERRSLADWWRTQRAARRGTPLERRVTRAHFAGRRKALTELGGGEGR